MQADKTLKIPETRTLETSLERTIDERTIDRSKVTVITLWDEPFSRDNTFNLDIYTSATEHIPAELGSYYADRITATYSCYLDKKSGINRVMSLAPETYRKSVGLAPYRAFMNPIMVAEIYGINEMYLVPECAMDMIIGCMRENNPQVIPGLNVRRDSLKQGHSVRFIERPLEEITSAIHSVLSVFPKEQTNLVVENYRMVGNYTLSN